MQAQLFEVLPHLREESDMTKGCSSINRRKSMRTVMNTKRYLLTLSIVLFSFVPVVHGSYVAQYAAAGTRQTRVTGIDGTVYTLDNLVDTTASHTVSGSGTAPSALFDGKFSGNNGRWYSNASSKYVTFAFDTPTVVNAYAIYNGNSQYSNPSRAPKTWTLQGSSDNVNWDDVDSQSDETGWAAGELRLYVFKNTTAYTYYKITVAAQNGDSYVQIHELEFYNFASFSLASSGSVDITPSSFGAVFSLLCDGTAECTLRYGTSPDNLSLPVSLGALSKGVYTNAVTGLAFDTSYWWSVSASNGSETLESSTNAVRTSGAPVLGVTTVTTDGNAATFSVSLEEAAMANTVGTAVTVAYGTSANDLSETIPMGVVTAASSFSQIVSNLAWGTTYYYAATATATVEDRVLSVSSSTNSFVARWDGEMYVDASAKNATKPYNTPEIAAKTISAAIFAATNGATIHVAPGLYAISSPLEVRAGIRILGADPDPSRTIVSNTTATSNANQYKRVFTINHADAVVANLTMQKGEGYGSYHGGNFYIGSAGGIVSNCVVESGYCRDNAVAAGAKLDAGIVTHTVFRKNRSGSGSANWSGNRPGVLELNGSSRIENCLFVANNQTVAVTMMNLNGSSVMRNCTIVDSSLAVTNAYCPSWSALNIASGVTVQNVVIAGVTNTVDGAKCKPTGTRANFVNGALDSSIEGTTFPADTIVGAAESFFKDYANGDYTPKAGGPLVGNGENYEGMASVDLAGNPRKIGSKIDIGCYEVTSTALVIIIR